MYAVKGNKLLLHQVICGYIYAKQQQIMAAGGDGQNLLKYLTYSSRFGESTAVKLLHKMPTEVLVDPTSDLS